MKDKIQKLLTKRNIAKVVYVDNEFEKDVYKDGIFCFLREHIEDNIEWPFSIEAGVDYALSECEKWFNNAQPEEIMSFATNQKISKKCSDIERHLQDCLPEGILECLTPAEFKKQYIDEPTFHPSETNQLVILMDMYLQEDDKDSGMRLLQHFVDQDNIACGLFSNRFDVDKEIENWKECKNAQNIFPIAKARFSQEDSDSALQGLCNVLWLRQISDVKQGIRKLYEEAFKQANEDIDNIDPASFDLAVIKNSRNEGCWEFDVLKRIMLLLLNRKIENLMVSGRHFPNIQDLTKTLKQINTELSDANIPDTDFLRNLYRSEVYDDIEYVNATFSQIANGDIFEITEETGTKRYMLVCQPCNLELRGNTSRKSSDFVYLLPIEVVENNNPYISTLQRISEDDNLCVNLARSVRINPRILDLVCYNKDGKSIIDVNKDSTHLENVELMQENLLAHYDKIRSKIDNYVHMCKVIANINNDTVNKSDKNMILKLLKKPFEMASDKLISVAYDEGTNIVDFKIKRVARYKEPFSQIILQDFMDYLSRQALPNNFSKIK